MHEVACFIGVYSPIAWTLKMKICQDSRKNRNEINLFISFFSQLIKANCSSYLIWYMYVFKKTREEPFCNKKNCLHTGQIKKLLLGVENAPKKLKVDQISNKDLARLLYRVTNLFNDI